MNLLSNAFKFTQTGGITVTIQAEQKRILNDSHEAKFLVFEITDTGVGMAKSEIKNLFTMFSTLNRHKRSMNIRGTGLGLTISKKLTEMLGGEISVKSVENKGTTFRFDIKESSFQQSSGFDEVNSESQNSCNPNTDISELLLSLDKVRVYALKSINVHSSKLLK